MGGVIEGEGRKEREGGRGNRGGGERGIESEIERGEGERGYRGGGREREREGGKRQSTILTNQNELVPFGSFNPARQPFRQTF